MSLPFVHIFNVAREDGSNAITDGAMDGFVRAVGSSQESKN
jgi:hypothetical protein